MRTAAAKRSTLVRGFSVRKVFSKTALNSLAALKIIQLARRITQVVTLVPLGFGARIGSPCRVLQGCYSTVRKAHATPGMPGSYGRCRACPTLCTNENNFPIDIRCASSCPSLAQVGQETRQQTNQREVCTDPIDKVNSLVVRQFTQDGSGDARHPERESEEQA